MEHDADRVAHYAGEHRSDAKMNQVQVEYNIGEKSQCADNRVPTQLLKIGTRQPEYDQLLFRIYWSDRILAGLLPTCSLVLRGIALSLGSDAAWHESKAVKCILSPASACLLVFSVLIDVPHVVKLLASEYVFDG